MVRSIIFWWLVCGAMFVYLRTRLIASLQPEALWPEAGSPEVRCCSCWQSLRQFRFRPWLSGTESATRNRQLSKIEWGDFIPRRLRRCSKSNTMAPRALKMKAKGQLPHGSEIERRSVYRDIKHCDKGEGIRSHEGRVPVGSIADRLILCVHPWHIMGRFHVPLALRPLGEGMLRF